MTLSNAIAGKLKAYFIKKLGAYDYNKGWMKSDCPECGHHKFGIKLSENRTNCFRCEYRPRPIDLVVTLENLETRASAYIFLKALEGVRYFEPIVTSTSGDFKPKVIDVSLPESFKLLTFGKSRSARIARNYMRKRGFDIEELSLQGIGYCDEGKYADHIIIPFYKNGSLVYFIARRYRLAGPRYNNPPVEDFGISKSTIIYNVDSLFIYDTCIVLEGAINCLVMGEEAISMQGKSFSSYQLNILKKAPCKNYIIILDTDAVKQAIDYGIQLIKCGKNISVVQLPIGKDPNDLGKETVDYYIKEAGYETYNSLLMKKLWYEAHPDYTY